MTRVEQLSMSGKKPKLNTIILKNRSSRPMTLKRSVSGFEYVVNPLSGIGLDIFKESGFIGIDWDTRSVWVDVGEPDE